MVLKPNANKQLRSYFHFKHDHIQFLHTNFLFSQIYTIFLQSRTTLPLDIFVSVLKMLLFLLEQIL